MSAPTVVKYTFNDEEMLPEHVVDELVSEIKKVRAERDRLQNQIFDAFSYFKESTAEQVCEGPEPKLVFELVEQLWMAYLKLKEENKRLIAALEQIRWLDYHSNLDDAVDIAWKAVDPEGFKKEFGELSKLGKERIMNSIKETANV